MNLLTIEDVGHAYFGRTVLDRICFRVRAGEIVALVGPSGCGKSTLLQIAAGLIEPMQGRALRAYARHAMVFQESRLLAWANGAENIAYGLQHAGLSPRALKQRVAATAGLVGLDDADLSKFPVELSGGMKQRVAIARALAVEPDFIYFDEPFSALDIGLRRRLQDLAVVALAEAGVGALFVTHDITEASRVAHRILVLASDGAGIAGERIPDGAPVERDVRGAFQFAERLLQEDSLFAHINDVDERRL